MIYFLIPLFNEEPNLETLAKNLFVCLPEEKKFYVFVDDGSKDRTVELIKNLFKDKPYELLSNGGNKGPGFSFNNGFEWIIQHAENDDYIVTMEGDNTSDIKILPQMVIIGKLGYDLILASVYAQGGSFSKTSFFRKTISFWANILIRFYLGIKVQTLSSFYRVYHVGLVKEIKERYKHIIVQNGFISMIEILHKAIQLNAKIIEVPMVLKSDARKGKSKMKIFKTGIDYIKFIFKINIFKSYS